MSNLVIVAIPSKDDHVWKISSEKVPHMTVLFLGEVTAVNNIAQIADFITHAANTSLHKFGMSVDRRDTLGEDEADVLFFNKQWSTEIYQFRTYLLRDDNIKTAYDSVEQFDEWQPHLTLGYPATPAKEDDRDWPIQYVDFDRIGFWFGDYAGIEIPLKDYEWNWDESEMAMGVMDTGKAVVEDYIQHYGVKGMKWGVRKDGPPAPSGVRTTVKPRAHMKTKVKTRGGRAEPAVAEAIAARQKQQVLKKSGVNALTNADLQMLQTRLNLEQNVARLAKTKVNHAGKQWVEGELKKQGSAEISRLVAKRAAKLAATAAAVA